jgi:hypothetical protein
MAAGERGQSQNWMDFASGGAALDRAAQQRVQVDGSGKILVDFQNMPRGVTGQAQGEGLFRKTQSANPDGTRGVWVSIAGRSSDGGGLVVRRPMDHPTGRTPCCSLLCARGCRLAGILKKV